MSTQLKLRSVQNLQDRQIRMRLAMLDARGTGNSSSGGYEQQKARQSGVRRKRRRSLLDVADSQVRQTAPG